ncbi:nucleotide exchange factor GrpE [Nonlabens dokdonensis]|nr:nucleotide exchange factor GrpE [Nonlabens dokdonensis]
MLNIFKRYRQKMAKDKKEKDLKEQDAPEVMEQETEEKQEERSEVEILEEQVKTEKDKFMRLFAEFENFKKRTAKERIELFKTAGEGVLKDMLPVLDDFDRAMVEINKSEDEQLITGVKLISGKLRTTLKSKGLEEFDVRAGDTFNADIHEAITQIPAPSDDMKGKIVDVIEKGYKLGDKIIRFPKVVIGQ